MKVNEMKVKKEKYYRECSGCGIQMVVPAVYDEGDCICPQCQEPSDSFPEQQAKDSVSEALINIMSLIPHQERKEAAKWIGVIQSAVERVTLDSLLEGFLNKSALKEAGHRIFSMAARQKTPTSILFIDVNDMRQMNKRWGHPTTDQILKQIGLRIQKAVRDTDILGRFGGDEIVVILPDTDAIGASEVAERISRSMFRPFWEMDGKRAGLSIGISEGEVFEGCLDQANQAMYQAKRNKRNGETQTCVYQEAWVDCTEVYKEG